MPLFCTSAKVAQQESITIYKISIGQILSKKDTQEEGSKLIRQENIQDHQLQTQGSQTHEKPITLQLIRKDDKWFSGKIVASLITMSSHDHQEEL